MIKTGVRTLKSSTRVLISSVVVAVGLKRAPINAHANSTKSFSNQQITSRFKQAYNRTQIKTETHETMDIPDDLPFEH